MSVVSDSKPASPQLDALVEALTGFLPEALRVTSTPGVTIALAVEDQPVWEAGFGHADLATGRPMTPDTTFRVGSFAKLYVAVALMQLAERGRVSLHAPVTRYVPHLDVVNPLGERDVTIYDLLTHRSGLATDTVDASLDDPAPLSEHLARGYRDGRMREYNHGLPRWTAKVGERFQYSSFGLATLGHLAECVNDEGLDFAAYVREHITGPLGATSSCFPSSRRQADYPQEVLERLATGYACFGQVLVPTPVVHSADSPSAGLITTAGDHLALLLALMGGGSHAGARLLDPTSVLRMLTPQAPVAQFVPGSDYWIGLSVELSGPDTVDFNYGHGGSHAWGWWSEGRVYPHDGFALVVCANRWEMVRYHNPFEEIVPGLVARFVSAWLRAPADRRPQLAEENWASKASYAMGVMMVERVCGLLGAGERLSESALSEMVAGAAVLPSDSDDWDPEAFRRGAEAIAGATSSPSAIRDFLASPKMAIPQHELPLLALRFGKKAALPVPMRHWADGVEARRRG